MITLQSPLQELRKRQSASRSWQSGGRAVSTTTTHCDRRTIDGFARALVLMAFLKPISAAATEIDFFASDFAGCLLDELKAMLDRGTLIVYSVTPGNPTRLVGKDGLDTGPFIIGEFMAHDSKPSLGV
ncbi:hypothetical protein [Bradyrhizobium sp. USDA 10063]